MVSSEDHSHHQSNNISLLDSRLTGDPNDFLAIGFQKSLFILSWTIQVISLSRQFLEIKNGIRHGDDKP